jgi:hypothetical protein
MFIICFALGIYSICVFIFLFVCVAYFNAIVVFDEALKAE